MFLRIAGFIALALATANAHAADCKYRDTVSEWVYDPAEGDPEAGIRPGTSFEDLPDSWVSPSSGASKADFEPICEDEEMDTSAPSGDYEYDDEPETSEVEADVEEDESLDEDGDEE